MYHSAAAAPPPRVGTPAALSGARLPELLADFGLRAREAHPSSGGSVDKFNATVLAFEELCGAAPRRAPRAAAEAREAPPREGGAPRGGVPQPGAARRQDLCVALGMGAPGGGANRTSRDERFLSQLHSLLRRLEPELRREAIERRLTQAQRERLERWMLSQRQRQRPGRGGGGGGLAVAAAPPQGRPRAVPPRPALTARSLCASARGGYRPTAHLAGGLYAQASFSYDLAKATLALGALIALRSLCQALAGHASAAGAQADFDGGVLWAAGAVLGGWPPGLRPVLYFRSRVALGRGCELATPSRSDPAAALLDRRRLLGSLARAAGSQAKARLAGARARRRVAQDSRKAWGLAPRGRREARVVQRLHELLVTEGRLNRRCAASPAARQSLGPPRRRCAVGAKRPR